MQQGVLHDLNVGDDVEFELGIAANGAAEPFPRWDSDRDGGGSGVWWRGTVQARHPDGDIEVVFSNPRTGRSELWAFPGDGFGAGRAGWVRKIPQPPARICECGATKIWGIGPHSFWCPMDAVTRRRNPLLDG